MIHRDFLSARALAVALAIFLAQAGAGRPAFVCTDYTQGKVFIISPAGAVEWEYPAEHVNDLQVLSNGDLLFNDGSSVKEVTREKHVVFDFESASPIYACQRLTNGNTFIGECDAARLLEVSPAGAILKEVHLLPPGQNGGSAYMRNARRLENGHYLVAHYGADVVREYDEHGKVVLEIPAPGGPHSVERLPNGHTLISCADHPGGPQLFEADAAGHTVWALRPDDAPQAQLKFIAGFQRRPNGNIVLANWLGHGSFPDAPQLVEVTPRKQVVWTFAGRAKMKTISNVRMLDAPDPLVIKVREAALAIQRYSWEQGTLALAFLEAGDDAMVVKMARASLIYRSKLGVPAALGGAPVDPLMGGEALWRAAQLTGDPELQEAATNALNFALRAAPRAADGTVFHTGQTMWSDSFNTTPPFLAAAGHFDEAMRQIEGHRRRLWNPEAKLLAHIWNEKNGNFQDPKFWGGGQGWAAAALARVIRACPPDRATDRDKLVDYLKALLDGCLAHQSPGGLFYNVVDDPATFEETNLAQMLAYAIYTSVRGGWLDASYLPAADRMRAAARAKVDHDGFVRGACGAPEFNQPGISAEAQAFFLLMETAAEAEGR